MAFLISSILHKGPSRGLFFRPLFFSLSVIGPIIGGMVLRSSRARPLTALKPKSKTARKKTIVLRKTGNLGQNIQLYGLAYRIAWKQISALRKRPDIALRLHASIRSQLRKGATDPFVIASEALKALDESEPGTK